MVGSAPQGTRVERGLAVEDGPRESEYEDERGWTHLAHKAEHVVDRESELILAPQICLGDTTVRETNVAKADH